MMHSRSGSRALRPLSETLQRQRESWAPATALARIQALWREAVGEHIAAEARPTAQRGGILTVSCSAAVWAQELDLSAELVLQRLRQLAPELRLERLRCVCDGQAAPPTDPARRRGPAAGPRQGA